MTFYDYGVWGEKAKLSACCGWVICYPSSKDDLLYPSFCLKCRKVKPVVKPKEMPIENQERTDIYG